MLWLADVITVILVLRHSLAMHSGITFGSLFCGLTGVRKKTTDGASRKTMETKRFCTSVPLLNTGNRQEIQNFPNEEGNIQKHSVTCWCSLLHVQSSGVNYCLIRFCFIQGCYRYIKKIFQQLEVRYIYFFALQFFSLEWSDIAMSLKRSLVVAVSL